MSKSIDEKSENPRDKDRYWIVELAIFATITPALIYAVLSLNNLPYFV